MRWFLKKLALSTAVAAMLTMLAVQTFHSPLSHLGEDCHLGQCASTRQGASVKAAKSSCQKHVHRHSHGGTCHVHVHSHAPVNSGPESSETDGESDHDHPLHHDCGYCQFLTQTAQPVSCPVLLMGEDVVSIRPVDLTPDVIVIPLSKPHVRGPPSMA